MLHRGERDINTGCIDHVVCERTRQVECRETVGKGGVGSRVGGAYRPGGGGCTVTMDA